MMHSTRRYTILFIGVLLALVGLVGGAAPAAQAVELATGRQTLTGTLTVITGDPMPVEDEPMAPIPPIFTLHLADGGNVRLLPGAVNENDLLKLNRQLVTVTLPTAEAEKALSTDAGIDGVVVSAITLAPGAAEASQVVSGNTRWITVACKFPNRPNEPYPLTFFQEMYANVYPGLDHYWREASYSAINLAGSGAVGWYEMPLPTEAYAFGSGNSPVRDCLKLADPDVYFPDYYGIAIAFNADLYGAAWGGNLADWTFDGVKRSYGFAAVPVVSRWPHGVLQHEMGHAYGLLHSLAGDNYYGNLWDVMSANSCGNTLHPVYGCVGQHTLAYNRFQLGWIPLDRHYVAGRGFGGTQAVHTITLEGATLPGPTGYLLAIVPINGSATHFYTVEARRLVGYDANLPGTAVIIHEIGGASPLTQLVDLSLYNWGDGESAMWPPGEAFGDPVGEIIIRVDAATPTGFTVTIFNGGVEPRTMTLVPTSDAYVREDQPAASANTAALVVRGATPRRWTALRFNSDQIPPATYSLRLRMAVVAGDAADPGHAYPQASYSNCWPGEWNESLLTWNSFDLPYCPGYDNDAWAQHGTGSRAGDWVEWNLTPFSSRYGLDKVMVIDSSTEMQYSSREGANPPQLIIEYLVPPDEPETHTFTPTNDATTNQAMPNAIYGTKLVLQVKDAAKDMNTYLKFNAQGLTGTVQSATLRLFVKDPGPDGGKVYAVSPFYKNTTTFWLETGLKWNNAPPQAGAPLDSVGRAVKGQWVELDVTSAVVAALNDNGRVSLLLTNDSTNLVTYSSKEGAKPPELVVVTSNE